MALTTPTAALLSGHYALLSGLDYPVYDAAAVPANAPAPRITISPVQGLADNVKDRFGWVATIQVSVVTKAPAGQGSHKANAELTSAVLGLLLPSVTTIGVQASGYHVFGLDVTERALPLDTPSGVVLQTILTLKYRVTQL